MGQLNLYKIDNQQTEVFLDSLDHKYNPSDSQVVATIIDDNPIEYELTLYTLVPDQENIVEWKWLLDQFLDENYTTRSNPKGILVIVSSKSMYACTYGFSFFTVDKYCDTDFAFNFARKQDYSNIKTTSLTSPTSRRNKTVNSYINYTALEFSSGEAFSKIKGKLSIPENFPLFDANIELGHSIKFNLKVDSIDNILKTIEYVETTIEQTLDKHKIPVFNKVFDKILIERLNENLINVAQQEELSVSFSEFDIIGATEVFNTSDYKFTFEYKKHIFESDNITLSAFKDFAQICNLDLGLAFSKIKIVSYCAGAPIKTDKLINLIDFVDEENRCVLSKGKWYYFNDDYLTYLSDSLSEIDIHYHPEYDFNDNIHNAYIEAQFQTYKDTDDYKNLTKSESKAKLKRKFYAERTFNLLREENDGFQNFDRVEQRYGNASIELMDIYKNNTLFAVKIAKSSAHLCYVIDQSLSSLKMYQHNLLKDMPTIDAICIWIILEDRKNHLPLRSDGSPDINNLDMLLLKNRIDGWKKEVRLAGYKPIIYINYRN